MNNYKIPSIEEIYNVYHRETIYAAKGIYPRNIKNFEKVINDTNKELLIKFQNMIKSNFDSMDWKIYIKACSQYFKRRFDLKILASLKGNKIYRDYLRYNNLSQNKSNEDIKNEIIDSLKFLKEYLINSNISFNEYVFNNKNVIPTFLNHIYSGSISSYFYACFDMNKIYKMLNKINDDIFYELFNCSRNEFIEKNIYEKHNKILRIAILKNIINKINEKFNNFL